MFRFMLVNILLNMVQRQKNEYEVQLFEIAICNYTLLNNHLLPQMGTLNSKYL